MDILLTLPILTLMLSEGSRENVLNALLGAHPEDSMW